MISYAKTRLLLTKLDRRYQDCSLSEPTLAIAYSKIAVLEVCGWLEESFDEIAHNCVRSRLRTLERRKFLEDKIKSTYGFEYNSKARPLISHAIGVVRLLEVEKQLEVNGSLTILKSACANLNKLRQDAAHRTLAGRIQIYPAPSVAAQQFNICLPIITKMWALVRS